MDKINIRYIMKNLTIFFLLFSITSYSQELPTPPAGSKGASALKSGSEYLLGRTGSWSFISRKTYVDSLFSLGYSKAQVDSAIAANTPDLQSVLDATPSYTFAVKSTPYAIGRTNGQEVYFSNDGLQLTSPHQMTMESGSIYLQSFRNESDNGVIKLNIYNEESSVDRFELKLASGEGITIGRDWDAINQTPYGVRWNPGTYILGYLHDYSSNFTDRSLVDKKYVDDQVAFNILDVSQFFFTDKAINVKPFNNVSVVYREGSIDFGISRSAQTMGYYSFKQGVETVASGSYSSAFGEGSTASGVSSVAFGSGTLASSSASSAFGVSTKATGSYSSAFGDNTTASGNASSAFGDRATASGAYSTAFGRQTIASGSNSSAFGFYAVANEYASLAIGRYSTEGAAQSSWSLGSPIFKVGNGTSAANRSNSYVLYNDGRSEQVKDIEVTEIGQGVVIKSPDGTRWRITVDDSGNLITNSL